MTASTIRTRLQKLADPKYAKNLQWFFKTGPGEYGEGDIFIGIRVPFLRKLSKEFQAADLQTILDVLNSGIHEERLFALMLLVRKYGRGSDADRKEIYSAYLRSTRHINNWDLVDLSCRYIVGAHLADKDRGILYKLVKSRSLWERRIAIISTFHFIAQGDFKDAVRIAELLLKDREDLIHKASGWVLREVGKKDVKTLEAFLDKHCTQMPRTMLRYAIEKFPEPRRQHYLSIKAL